MKGVKHYKKDGTEHKGNTHKMPNGTLHTNKSHTKTSVPLFHYKDLSAKAKEKRREFFLPHRRVRHIDVKQKRTPAIHRRQR